MNNSLLKQIEQDIAILLTKRLESKQLTPERAKEIARFVLRALPETIGNDSLIHIVPKLDDNFAELAPIVEKYFEPHEEMEDKARIQELRRKLATINVK